MSTIAEELLAVLKEVGSPYTVIKPNGDQVTGEYLDLNDHAEHTNSSIRAFFYDMSLHNPSKCAVGDILRIDSGGAITDVLLTVKAPQGFSGEIVEFTGSGFLANATGHFEQYNQNGGFDSDNNRIKNWVDLYPGVTVRGAMMDRLYRSSATGIANETVDVQENALQFYISSYYAAVEMGNRWVGDDGTKYKVDQIEEHNFTGIRVVFLSEYTGE